MKKNHKNYLSLIHTSNDKMPQKNTKVDIRKTPPDEIEKSPGQSKYSKDDTEKEKDPYPWLGENDPRRYMTAKEVLESTLDLSEACITERQKQA